MINYNYDRDFKKYSILRMETEDDYPLFCSLKYDLQSKMETISISDLEDIILYKEILPLGYGFIRLINIDINNLNKVITNLYNLKILNNKTSLQKYLSKMSDNNFTLENKKLLKKQIDEDVEQGMFVTDKKDLNNIETTIFSCLDDISSLHPWLIDYSYFSIDIWLHDIRSLKGDYIYPHTDVFVLKKIYISMSWYSIINYIMHVIDNLKRDIKTIEKYKKGVDLCLNISRNDDWIDIPLSTRLYIANKYFDLELERLSTTTITEINIKNTPEKKIYEKKLAISELKELYKDCIISFDEKIESHQIHNACYSSFLNMIKTDTYVKKCANCGNYFIPQNRSDTLYCDGFAPQDATKTCKEYGARKTYQENLNNNTCMKLYRNVYMAKQMLVKRNPNVIKYHDDFEDFKIQSKQWKKGIKDGVKTEQEYIQWLNSVKGKRGATIGNDTETK